MTTNLDELGRLDGRLQQAWVWEWTSSDPEDQGVCWIVAVDLVIDDQSCLVRAVGADDTLVVRVRAVGAAPDVKARWAAELADKAMVVRDASGDARWRDLVGRHLLWAWTMRNHRAPDDDAVQFSFCAPGNLADVLTLQMVTVASTLRVYSLTLVPLDR